MLEQDAFAAAATADDDHVLPFPDVQVDSAQDVLDAKRLFDTHHADDASRSRDGSGSSHNEIRESN